MDNDETELLAESRITQWKKIISSKDSQIQKLQQQLRRLDQTVQQLSNPPEGFKISEYEEYKLKFEHAELSRVNEARRVSALRHELDSLIASKSEDFEAARAAHERIVDSLRSEISRLGSEMSSMSRLRADLDEARVLNARARGESAANRAALDESVSRHDLYKSQMDSELSLLRVSHDHAIEESTALRREIEELRLISKKSKMEADEARAALSKRQVDWAEEARSREHRAANCEAELRVESEKAKGEYLKWKQLYETLDRRSADDKAVATEEIKLLRSQLKHVENDLNVERTSNVKDKEKREADAEKKIKEITNSAEKVATESKKLQEAMKDRQNELQNRIKTLELQLEHLTVSSSDKSVVLAGLEEELKNSRASCESLKHSVDIYERDLASFQIKQKETLQELHQSKKQTEDYHEKIHELEQELSAYQCELKREKKAKIQEIMKMQVDCSEKITTMKLENSSLESRLDKAISDHKNSRQEFKSQEADLERKNKELSKRIQDLNVQVETAIAQKIGHANGAIFGGRGGAIMPNDLDSRLTTLLMQTQRSKYLNAGDESQAGNGGVAALAAFDGNIFSSMDASDVLQAASRVRQQAASLNVPVSPHR